MSRSGQLSGIGVTVKEVPNALVVKAAKIKVVLKLAKVKKAVQKVSSVKVVNRDQGTIRALDEAGPQDASCGPVVVTR